MERVEKTIEVDCPVRTVYNQWTQFEEFPRFMDGVEEVRQLDDTHVHWRAQLWGKSKEWDAEITEQEPDKRISWRSVSGAPNAGTVRFEPLGTDRCEGEALRGVLSASPEAAPEIDGLRLALDLCPDADADCRCVLHVGGVGADLASRLWLQPGPFEAHVDAAGMPFPTAWCSAHARGSMPRSPPANSV